MKDVDLQKRLEELNCDPLDLSARIAAGEPLQLVHPDYIKIRKQWNTVLQALSNGKINVTQLESFWHLLDTALRSSIPSAELRSKHILSLNEYLFAKKKAVENTTRIERFESHEELSDELLEALIRGEEVDIDIGDEDASQSSA